MTAPHRCIACPVEVRDLLATAVNCILAVDAARLGRGSWERANEKTMALRVAADRMQGRTTADDITHLAIVAWRFAWAAHHTAGNVVGDAEWYAARFEDLRIAAARAQVLVDRHFADCGPVVAVPYDAMPVLPAGAGSAVVVHVEGSGGTGGPAPVWTRPPVKVPRGLLMLCSAAIMAGLACGIWYGSAVGFGFAMMMAAIMADLIGVEVRRQTFVP